MKITKDITRQLVIILILFISSIGMMAQTTKSTGTRITDVITDKELSKTAILDLDSSTKGFYMPRMNEAQRSELEKKLIAEGNKNTGLVIYNIDNDCIEYWHSSTQKWRSLCGSLPPADIVVDGTCDNIIVNGFVQSGVTGYGWQQGKSLNDTHTMIVPIKVNKIGTYTASAVTDNGYFFSGEGQFQAVGTYFVTLKGAGTPIRGYDQVGTGKKGDKVVINFNGIDSKICTDLEIKIIPADLKLTIKTDVYKAEGKYYVNESAANIPGNKLNIKITVTSPGTATIIAYNRELGIKFSGTKTVENGVDQDFELLPVVGEAVPKLNDKDSYDMIFGVNVVNEPEVIEGKVASITIEPTELTFKETDVVYSKELLYRDTPLNDKHSITIPVNVIGSGKTTLRLKDTTGKIEFVAKDVVLNKESEGKKQNIVFVPTIKSDAITPNTETMVLKLTGDAPRFKVSGTDQITVSLLKKPVTYTIDCENIKPNRSAIPFNVAVADNYYIKVPVDVTIPGEYQIYTVGSADGVTFSSNINGVKQVFPTTGKQEVKLYPVDKTIVPKNRGTYAVDIVVNDGSTNTGCSSKFDVKVGFADINILYYHGDENNNGTIFENFINGNDKVTGKKRFGPDGVVVETGITTVTKFKVTRKSSSAPQTNTAVARAALVQKIKAGEFNLIIMDSNAILRTFEQEMYDAVVEYINKDNAFIVFTNNANGGSRGDTYVSVLNRYNPSNKLSVIGDVDTTIGTKLLDEFNNNVALRKGYTDTSLFIGTVRLKDNAYNDLFYMKPYTLKAGKAGNYYVAFNNYTSTLALEIGKDSQYEQLLDFGGNSSSTYPEEYSIGMRHKKFRKFFWLMTNGSGSYGNVTFNPQAFNSTTGEPNAYFYINYYDYMNDGGLIANITSNLISILANE